MRLPLLALTLIARQSDSWKITSRRWRVTRMIVTFFAASNKKRITCPQYVGWLREQGRLCDYGASLDMRITEQVFDHCRMNKLGEVILKKKLMIVTDIVEEARIFETVRRNREQMVTLTVPAETEGLNQGI